MGLDIVIMVCCPWIIASGTFMASGAFRKPRNYGAGIIDILITAFGIWLFVSTVFKLGI